MLNPILSTKKSKLLPFRIKDSIMIGSLDIEVPVKYIHTYIRTKSKISYKIFLPTILLYANDDNFAKLKNLNIW